MKMKQPLQVLFLEFLLGVFLEGKELLHYTSQFPCSAISFTTELDTILTLGLVNSHSVCAKAHLQPHCMSWVLEASIFLAPLYYIFCNMY